MCFIVVQVNATGLVVWDNYFVSVPFLYARHLRIVSPGIPLELQQWLFNLKGNLILNAKVQGRCDLMFVHPNFVKQYL